MAGLQALGDRPSVVALSVDFRRPVRRLALQTHRYGTSKTCANCRHKNVAHVTSSRLVRRPDDTAFPLCRTSVFHLIDDAAQRVIFSFAVCVRPECVAL
jgi:hypothetical protein